MNINANSDAPARKPPTVTVCMVSYNHAPYVGEAISSVLRQSYTDFEFLIFEHASTDATLEVIKTFNDPRIKLTVVDKNYHSTHAANQLLTQVSGTYIALLCSDDAWHENKLAEQVAYLEQHDQCGVVFSRVDVVNAQGKVCPRPTVYSNTFNTPQNRDKDAWLRFMYAFQNPFCCSSACMRASVWQQCGPYDVRSRMVQDLILWMCMLFQHEVHILDNKLATMRSFADQSNVSSTSASNMILAGNEARLFYEAFFARITSGEVLARIFPHTQVQYGHMFADDLPLALALHGLNGSNIMVRSLALDKLYALMKNEENRRRYEERYGFSVLDLYALAEDVDTHGQRVQFAPLMKKLLVDTCKNSLRKLGLLEQVKSIVYARKRP